MAQRIGFCTAPDGVRLAYALVGEGPPLVYVPGWPTHLELEWHQPFIRQFLESLAAGHTLVRYDMRGSGLSDRVEGAFSMEALVADLGAVVDHLGLDRFAVLSMGDYGGPTAIAFAAEQPSRVSHLILHAPFLRGSDLTSEDNQDAIIEYTAKFGFPIFEFTDSARLTIEQQRRIREVDQASAEKTVGAALLKLMYATDVSSLAENAVAPALVMHGRHNPLTPFELGRDVAARLPNARFFPFEGDSASPLAEAQSLLPEIRAFLASDVYVGDPGTILGDLTPRELEILRILAAGASNFDIAARLTLSVRTVERHITNVYLKLGVHTRAQATALLIHQRSAISKSRRRPPT